MSAPKYANGINISMTNDCAEVNLAFTHTYKDRSVGIDANGDITTAMATITDPVANIVFTPDVLYQLYNLAGRLVTIMQNQQEKQESQ